MVCNSTERMIELYEERRSGKSHEILEYDEWFGHSSRHSFMVDFEYRLKDKSPENLYGATHYAILPDDTNVFYRISNGLSLMYFPLSKVWQETNDVPYTLYSFDEKGDL